MQFAVPAPTVPSVALAAGTARFPVHRIYCVGRNYADHAREMGADPDREPPFFFTKPPDAVFPSGEQVPYPLATRDLHHEIELVVAIGRAGVEIAESAALDHVYGYGVGIDLTRRDLQQLAKDKRRPWDSGKAFDRSAPIAPLHPVSEVGHPKDAHIWLEVNGETRQSGNINQLIWSVPEVIAILSREFHLAPGDLIFTGTPAGVGAIVAGDRITGGIDGLGEIAISLL